jgi:biopolymer transport protein ExbB
MSKSFLARTVFLIVLLAAVLVVIILVVRGSLGTGALPSDQPRTFFEQFVVAGGPIVWFVLLPMSLATVYLAVEHSLTIRRSRLVPGGIGQRISRVVQQYGPGRLEARISEQGDLASTAVVKAVKQGRGDWFRMRNIVAESLQDQGGALMRRIEWVNLIGNVSPMVGLFGTVFGMIKLFNAIVLAGGQPQPAQLAEGISIALVTTFWGLSIAIPALAVYGVFRNRIESLLSDAVEETEEVMARIRQGLRRQKEAEKPEQRHPITEILTKTSEVIHESPVQSEG